MNRLKQLPRWQLIIAGLALVYLACIAVVVIRQGSWVMFGADNVNLGCPVPVDSPINTGASCLDSATLNASADHVYNVIRWQFGFVFGKPHNAIYLPLDGLAALVILGVVTAPVWLRRPVRYTRPRLVRWAIAGLAVGYLLYGGSQIVAHGLSFPMDNRSTGQNCSARDSPNCGNLDPSGFTQSYFLSSGQWQQLFEGDESGSSPMSRASYFPVDLGIAFIILAGAAAPLIRRWLSQTSSTRTPRVL